MPAADIPAEIVIKREHHNIGMGLSWQVLLDGQFTGWLLDGTSSAFPAPPGLHAIVVSPANGRSGRMRDNPSEPFWFGAVAGGRIELATMATKRGPRAWCSAASAMPEASTYLPASVAEIVIKKDASFRFWESECRVLLDGQFAGQLTKSGFLAFQASPGSHAVTVARGGTDRGFRFYASAGRRIELVTGSTFWTTSVWRTEAPETSATPEPGIGMVGVPGTMAEMAGTVAEEARYEVPLGDDSRVIDNSRSDSAITRVVRLTREWTRTSAVDMERATTMNGSAGIRIPVLDLRAAAERSLSRRYSVSAEERETFEEEVTLTVAPRTRCQVIFSWKEIRQRGVVQFASDSSQARVPYEVVVGVTFDQQQIDDQPRS